MYLLNFGIAVTISGNFAFLKVLNWFQVERVVACKNECILTRAFSTSSKEMQRLRGRKNDTLSDLN